MSEPGLLEFTPGYEPLPGRGERRITVIVSSVACEGMRLSRPEPIDDLRPGAQINIRLHLQEREIMLPGQVAWLVTSNDGACNLGVSLWLEAATDDARHTWSRWIANQTETARAPVRRRESRHGSQA